MTFNKSITYRVRVRTSIWRRGRRYSNNRSSLQSSCQISTDLTRLFKRNTLKLATLLPSFPLLPLTLPVVAPPRSLLRLPLLGAGGPLPPYYPSPFAKRSQLCNRVPRANMPSGSAEPLIETCGKDVMFTRYVLSSRVELMYRNECRTPYPSLVTTLLYV